MKTSVKHQFDHWSTITIIASQFIIRYEVLFVQSRLNFFEKNTVCVF